MLYGAYYTPTSLEEALDYLSSLGGRGWVIAGGTDLIPQLKDTPRVDKVLIDISRIPSLKEISLVDNVLTIGSAVTHASLGSSKTVWQRATALVEAAQSVGSTQIRNQGTVGGNVVSALPAGDVAVGLVAFAALAEGYSIDGRSLEEEILNLYKGLGLSKIDPAKEIITQFKIRLPTKGSYGSSFMRLSKRKALSLPILNCGVVVVLEEERIIDCRIVVAPVAPVPFRARSAEGLLIGKEINEGLIEQASREASVKADPRDSIFRGSAGYRKEMVRVLVQRGLTKAIKRAKVSSVIPVV
ncbi:MAG: FAD binding domain-containing protein [Thermodesulfobacteriota bacterium]|jgi:carbon-monoxide dehydrogenase medium subunit